MPVEICRQKLGQNEIFAILGPLTQRDRFPINGKGLGRYRSKRCGRWCSKHRQLRHILVVYIRPDSSRVQSPSLSLSHPRSVLLGLSSFLPSFPCYITPISPRLRVPRRLYLQNEIQFRSLRVEAFTFLPLEYPFYRDVGENRTVVVQLQPQPQRRDDSLLGYCLHADRDYSSPIILSLSR